jgi:hypothetical protein
MAASGLFHQQARPARFSPFSHLCACLSTSYGGNGVWGLVSFFLGFVPVIVWRTHRKPNGFRSGFIWVRFCFRRTATTRTINARCFNARPGLLDVTLDPRATQPTIFSLDEEAIRHVLRSSLLFLGHGASDAV